MQIMSIRPNYTKVNYQRNILAPNSNVKTPSFKGVLSNNEYERVMRLIAEKNSEFFTDFSVEKLDKVITSLCDKYQCLGVKSAGLQIISKDDLIRHFGSKVAKYDTKNKMGLAVVVGNKYGPVELMDNIYEAKTFIIKPEELK
ncbi:MAG: hypothetical protein E7Z87_01665 [Cyanobacteria bacterium SIG26]|nr:hypothetical protein [Cyanobacteria bacterium SIG26]